MKRRLCSIFLAFLTMLTFGGCLPGGDDQGRSVTRNILTAPDIETGVLYSAIDEKEDVKCNIDLYYDVSMSMRGYMFPEYSRFSKVMEGIYTTAKTISNQEGKLKINTYQFGDTFRKLEDVSILKSWEGYTDLTSNIDLAIKKANLDNLSVIVTDMDIEEESLDTMINKIGSEYISQGYTIGIIGIKSEYTGYVYGLEKEGDRVVLLTDDKDPKDTYPFYLLILGKQASINNFYESLNTFILGDFPEETVNYTIIPLATKGIIESVNDSNVTFDYLNEESKIFVETELFPDCEQKQYKITREPKAEIGFKINGLTYENVPYIPDVMNQLYSNMQVLSYDDASGDWIEVEDKSGILTVTDNSTGDGIDTQMTVNPNAMEKGKTYAIKITSYLKQGEEDSKTIFEIPEWVKDWTTDRSKISTWMKEYNAFYKVYGKPASDKVVAKYRKWLKDNKKKTAVSLCTTDDLEKFFKKITYYVEKSEDTKVYSYVFYIQKQY